MAQIPKLKLLFILIFFTKLHLGNSQGQLCAVLKDCDPNAERFTTCVNGRCECLDPTDSVFLSPSQTCFKQAEKSCRFGISEKRCVPNSQCINDICKCNQGLESNGLGHCFITYGNTCDTIRDLCDPLAFLHCGKQMNCVCNNPEDTMFETLDSTCRLLAGSQCALNLNSQKCVEHANCNVATNKCECDAGYIENENRSCTKVLLQHGQPCQPGPAADSCDPSEYLECNADLRCECKDPENGKSIYDPSTNKCFISGNAECTPDGQMCVPNSECINEVCKCNSELIPNVEGRCFLTYNKFCNFQNDLCDPMSYLTCGQKQLCDCSDPKNTIYELSDSSCRLLAGSSCTSDVSPNTQKCVTNSKCSEMVDGSFRCECTEDFEQTEKKTCEKVKLDYGENCVQGVSTDLCDQSKFLECKSDLKCGCKETTVNDVYFDESTKTCFLLHDSPCDVGNDRQKCAPNSQCINELCKCDIGLHPNVEGRCFLPYNTVCNFENDLCDPVSHLACGLEQKCDCADPENTIYEDDLSCRLLAGSTCTQDVSPTSQKCITNSECSKMVDGSFSCECTTDFVQTERNTCEKNKLDYGEKCVPGVLTDLCDQSKFLECNSDLTCGCKETADVNAYFDESTKSCFLLHDSPCGVDNGSQKCGPNSQCITELCKCEIGLQPNAQGRCFLSYNTFCNFENDLCDPVSYLACGRKQLCDCADPDNTIYEVSDSSCRLLAGSSCTLDLSITTQKCITNSECSEMVDGSFRCECTTDFVPTERNTCEKNKLDYGENCVQGISTDLCDQSKFLECNSDLKCDCKETTDVNAYFDESTKSCFLLHDSPCDVGNGSQKCAPNSQCINELCKCDIDLYPNEENRCFLSYDNPCQFDVDLCDPKNFLHCGIEHKCTCNNSHNSLFDSVDQVCKLLSGTECKSGGQQCVTNSHCDLGFCSCLAGFVETEDKICDYVQLQHGELCDNTSPNDFCDKSKFLQCGLDNRCDCKTPLIGDVLFDDNTNMCYLLHNSDCEPEGQQCAPNSECLFLNTKYTCECQANMQPNTQGLCFLSYENSCKVSNDMCDPFEYLECGDEEKCNCKNLTNSVFEEINGQCHILSGSECTPDGQPCVSNSICDIQTKLCVCHPNFHPTDDRICVPNTLGFGDICSSINDKCNPERFLHCNSTTSVCDCLHSNSWYSSTTQMCYYLAEANCRVNAEQKCIPNAICNNDGVCQCKDGLFANENKLCYVDYLGKCNATHSHRDLCDPMRFLACGLLGVCDCKNFKDNWYNSTSRTCQTLATGNCSSTAYGDVKLQSCVAKALCNDKGFCECEQNFKANSTKFCTLGYGKGCLQNSYGKEFCNPENYLECSRNGRCGCKNYQYSFYDENTDYCFLIEGAPCSLDGQKCGRNSKCMWRNNEKDFKCTCADGFTPNENRLCFLPYNSTCSLKHDLCDPDGFLNCGLQQKCDCRDPTFSIYNADSKRCQLLANSVCYQGGRQQCVENAACLITPGGNSLCKCLGNFTINDFGLCSLLHGVPCNKNENKCDSKRFLTCSEYGSCICQNIQTTSYDPQTNYCYLKVGAHCNSTQNGQKCIPNSHCDSLTNTCSCNKEPWLLEANSLGHCTIPYSKPCSADNDLCDNRSFLQCNKENRCNCKRPENSLFNSKSGACELRAGVSCSLNNSITQNCFFGSECKPVGGGGSNAYVCTCVDKLSPNSNKICQLKHQQMCELDSNDYCDSAAFLSCDLPSKRCECHMPYTIFNDVTQKCERLPEGPCLSQEIEPVCIANSYCNSNTKTCVCDEGYEFSKTNHTCLKSHGVKCNATNECNGDNLLECLGGKCVCKKGYFPDEESGLSTQCLPGYLQSCNAEFPCVYESGLICTADSLCQCIRPNEQIFEPEKRKCVGLLGTPCSFDDIQLANATTSFCVSNADCLLSINGTGMGICQCNLGYVADDNKVCISCGNSFAFSSSIAILTVQIAMSIIRILE